MEKNSYSSSSYVMPIFLLRRARTSSVRMWKQTRAGKHEVNMGQLHKTGRADRGKWTNSDQKAEEFWLGGDNFRSLTLRIKNMWNRISYVSLVATWQLYLLESLVYNPMPQSDSSSTEGDCAGSRGHPPLCQPSITWRVLAQHCYLSLNW